jgi:hypothetical protein
MKQNKETIKSYFETGDRPTQQQYHDTWYSFWHKDYVIPSDDSLLLTSTITSNTDAIEAHAVGMNAVDSATDVTINIQDNSNEFIPIGSVLTYNQINEGRVIVAYSGLASGDIGQTYKKGDVLTLWQKSSNNWVVLNQPRAIDSIPDGEPAGSNQVLNIVSLTQAEYDAGTPVSTTLYNITDA